MNQGLPVFSQVMTLIHPQQFARCVARFPPPRALRSFSAWDHFLAMAFAQLTFRESLRDLEHLHARRHPQKRTRAVADAAPNFASFVRPCLRENTYPAIVC